MWRFDGTETLDPERVGRDASKIADEVLAHLVGQVGAEVTVTLEIEAFLRAIREGSPPVVSGEDGLRALDTAIRIAKLVQDGNAAV